MYDVCVVGGGAAGMSAAIAAAESGKKVIIVDKNEKLGKKIYATGNGRCNVTNRSMDYGKCFHSEYENYNLFVQKAFGADADRQVEEFLEHLGILTYTNQNGYVYPASEQASSVVWAFVDRLKTLGVEIKNKTEISSIDTKNKYFILKSKNEQITASQVILCCGGRSYSKLGGTDLGYKLAKDLGHEMCKIRPALCGLEVYDISETLSGVRVKARAALIDKEGVKIQEEKGELQFTDYGLSGIMIFNLSSVTGKLMSQGEQVSVSLCLLNDEEKKHLSEIYKNSNNRTVIGFLNGVLNDKLAEYVVNYFKLSRNTKLSEIDKKSIDDLLNFVTDMRFKVKGLRDFENAQVQAGGVSLLDIDADTFMSKKIPHLYIAGELLDIDGICGGYNLTFAILSGLKAGKGTR